MPFRVKLLGSEALRVFIAYSAAIESSADRAAKTEWSEFFRPNCAESIAACVAHLRKRSFLVSFVSKARIYCLRIFKGKSKSNSFIDRIFVTELGRATSKCPVDAVVGPSLPVVLDPDLTGRG